MSRVTFLKEVVKLVYLCKTTNNSATEAVLVTIPFLRWIGWTDKQRKNFINFSYKFIQLDQNS